MSSPSPSNCSAWSLWAELIIKHGGSPLRDELYEWFVADAKTLSYGTAGILRLLTKSETEAIRVLKFADARLSKRSRKTWHTFVKQNS